MSVKTILVAQSLYDGNGDYSQLPQWEHDCEKCVFLGQLHSRPNCDVWYCADSTSLIIRESSDAPNYASFPLSVVVQVAKGEGPGTMWSEAVSRYDDAVGVHGAVRAHHVDLEFEGTDPWDGGDFDTVVGLYADIKVRKTGRDYWIKDQHGNPLFLAEHHEDGGVWQVKEARFASLLGIKPPVLTSRNAIFLFAMLVSQTLTDTGH